MDSPSTFISTDKRTMSTEASERQQSLGQAPKKVAEACQGLRAFVSGRVFWFGLPGRLIEHAISVDHMFIWRQHLMWSKRNGDELRNILTQRFASSTVFLSLLLSTELGVLFSPSEPGDMVREALETADHGSIGFYTGIILCISIFLTVSGLIATVTAWSVFAPLSRENVHAVLRSALGLYAAQLPSNIIILAIYFFCSWIVLFWYILMPMPWAISLTVSGVIVITHVISTYSALGRLIMHTGAMGEEHVVGVRDQEMQTSEELYETLKKKMKVAKASDIPVNRQYRMAYQQSLWTMAHPEETPVRSPVRKSPVLSPVSSSDHKDGQDMGCNNSIVENASDTSITLSRVNFCEN